MYSRGALIVFLLSFLVVGFYAFSQSAPGFESKGFFYSFADVVEGFFRGSFISLGPNCGNGALDQAEGEECDDGGNVNGDGCSSTCLIETCGDGRINLNGTNIIFGDDFPLYAPPKRNLTEFQSALGNVTYLWSSSGKKFPISLILHDNELEITNPAYPELFNQSVSDVLVGFLNSIDEPPAHELLFYEEHSSSGQEVISNSLLDVAVISVVWTEVEPQRGVFNFGSLDTKIDQWDAAGKKIMLKVVPYGKTSDDSFTPYWVYDTVANISWDDDRNVSSPNVTVPVVWSENFSIIYEEYVANLSDKYSNDPRIDSIRIGVGHLGFTTASLDRWAQDPFGNAGWTVPVWEDYIKRVTNLYKNKFPNQNLYLVMTPSYIKEGVQIMNTTSSRINISEYAASRGIDLIFKGVDPDIAEFESYGFHEIYNKLTLVNYGEECDDGNLNNSDGCDSNCLLELGNCGNNITEPGEVCDGTDLAGQDCLTQGFTSGTLSCLSDCSGFDTTQCAGGANIISNCGELNLSNTVYELQQDILTPVSGDCFKITANNITLDGKGHSVFGIYAAQRKGVIAANVSAITIKNLSLSGFYEGIYFSGVNDSILANNVIRNSYRGILSTLSKNNAITENILSSHTYGIEILSGSEGNRIAYNEINESLGYGIGIFDSGFNEIDSNRLIALGNYVRAGGYPTGILSSTSSNTIIKNNILNYTKETPIGHNGFKGILVQSSGVDRELVNNTIEGGSFGIEVASSAVLAENNSISFVLKNGLVVSGSSNLFSNAQIKSAGEDAIVLKQESYGNVFRNIIVEGTNNAYYDLNIFEGANETSLVDMKIANYSFGGNRIIFKNSQFGEIRFLQAIIGTGNNLSNDVRIRNNSAIVESNTKPILNKSANVTLYGIGNRGFSIPAIFRDGFVCNSTTTPSCNSFTALTAENVSFGVSSWTEYEIGDAGVGLPDTIPPVISQVVNTSITGSSALITWTTNENSNSSVNYGTNSSLGQVVSSGAMTTSHSLQLLSLTNNTVYYFNVSSCDGSGNCAESGTYNFRTLESAAGCIPSNGGIEICDGLDNDCDNNTDEGGDSLCNDYNESCVVETCGFFNGTTQCIHSENESVCSNGLFCDGTEDCSIFRIENGTANSTTGCVAGTPPTIEDEFACTISSCDEINNLTLILNNSACTLPQLCFAGIGCALSGVCNNSVVENGEQCDSLNLSNQNCISQGYPAGGNLGCNSSCSFNYSGCSLLPLYSKFNGNTTNFVGVGNITNVTNPILEIRDNGMINFSGHTINFTRLDLNRYVFIEEDLIGIDMSGDVMDSLDVSAILSFYGVSFGKPKVLRDGTTCSESVCNITSYNTTSHVLKVRVSGFSNYTVVEDLYCNDGYCNNGETCGSCSQDCGACSGGGGGGGGGGSPIYQCNDHRDNDLDGAIDYPNDLGCNSTTDNSELSFAGTGGGCIASWTCGDYGGCVNGIKTRTCQDANSCGTTAGKPATEQSCGGDVLPEGKIRWDIVVAAIIVVLGFISFIIGTVLWFSEKMHSRTKSQIQKTEEFVGQ